ncbi:MAG: PLP-dependent lyase/thiolase [bacterium]
MNEQPLTPLEAKPDLAVKLGLSSLYFKREDLHPYKSHKGRSIPRLIDSGLNDGIRSFVISSSGNAGLAAAMHVAHLNKERGPEESIYLSIFVGNKISEEKFKALEEVAKTDPQILLEKVQRPLQSLLQMTRRGAFSLRQSTNDKALEGYKSLANELSEISDLKAVFIATSSGTTAEALHEEFLRLKMKTEIHIVQTTSCHPIAGIFDRERMDDDSEEAEPQNIPDSKATAISDKIAYRKEKVQKAVKDSEGGGWIVLDKEIDEAIKTLSAEAGIETTPNGALSFAGLLRAKSKGRAWDGPVVCIISGK